MKFLFIFFVLIFIPVSAYGLSMAAGYPEVELEPGESAIYQWELNSKIDEPLPMILHADGLGKELLSFDTNVVLPPNEWTKLDVEIIIPENYPSGYYEPKVYATTINDPNARQININISVFKYIKITVIPPQSEYKLDLQVGKGENIRNVLGDLTFINGTLSDFTAIIYNENAELSFNGNVINANLEEEMLQNGTTVFVEPLTDKQTHERAFELNFIPTSNATIFDVTGSMYTIDLVDDGYEIIYIVPIQSGTLTWID